MSGGRWDSRSNAGKPTGSFHLNPTGGQYKEEEESLFDYASNDLDDGFEKHDLVDSELLSGTYPSEDYTRFEDPILASFLQYEDANGGDEGYNKRMRMDNHAQIGGVGGFLNTGVGSWMDPSSAYSSVGQGKGNNVQSINYSQPQTGNRAPQSAKRANYDILSSFFRVYFQPDPNSSILKDIVYILYWKKILPVVSKNSQAGVTPASNNMNSTNTPLAKNAVYRKMWSVFKDMTTFPEDKQVIKGLRLVTAIEQVPSVLDKDVELLRHYLGTNDIFGFTLEELEREVPFDPPQQNPTVTAGQTQPLAAASSSKTQKSGDPPFQSSLYMRLERLEQLSSIVNTEITEMKNLIKKEMIFMAERKRKLQSSSNT